MKDNNKFTAKSNNSIEELKKVLPGYETYTDLTKISNGERAGACPFCGGTDRFRVTDKGLFFCRQCAPEMNQGAGDIIAFHQKKFAKTIPELCKEYLTDYSKAGNNKPVPEQSQQQTTLKAWKDKKPGTKELALTLLCDERKIDKKVVSELFEAGQIKTGKHNQCDSVAFPFFNIDDETITGAIQCLTVDSKPYAFTAKNSKPVNKVFRKGDKPGSDCFFKVGASIQDTTTDLIISESVINAITAYECIPGACSLALGSSTYTQKLECLKPHVNGRKVIVCGDNDLPGQEMVIKVRQALGSTVHTISFKPEDQAGCDINDLLQAGQKERIIKLINDASLVPDDCLRDEDREAERKEKEKILWELAKDTFPRAGFPWHVLPASITGSLKQLARSCATSPLSLPGSAMAIFSSVLGSTISVSPKKSWKEPLIFWFGDVRPSGTGKTPAARKLDTVIKNAQRKADDEEKKAQDIEAAKPPKEREPVTRARGYFITNLTLEGIRDDISGHGGTVCIMDELSSFVNGQNQYKSSGTDREAWLELYDGRDARVVRAGKAQTIRGSRVNIFGGIQPKVFNQCFTDKDGLYLEDGTLFRFLLTHGTYEAFKITRESWSDESKKVWEDALFFAMQWADSHLNDHGLEPKVLALNSEAQDLFFNWVNKLKDMQSRLPIPLRGFLPKSHGYALRLAGLLYCIDCFVKNQEPKSIINSDAMQKGIDVAEFYLSHAVTLLESLEGTEVVLPELTEQGKILISTLEKLRPELDNGRLAIGFILKHYNKAAPKENQLNKSGHAMGSFIRNQGLTIEQGCRANGGENINALLWDKKTEHYLKQSPRSPLSPQRQQTSMFAGGDFGKTKSPKSPQKEKNINPGDLGDFNIMKSPAASLSATRDGDKGDFGDFNSKVNIKNNLPDDVEYIKDGALI